TVVPLSVRESVPCPIAPPKSVFPFPLYVAAPATLASEAIAIPATHAPSFRIRAPPHKCPDSKWRTERSHGVGANNHFNRFNRKVKKLRTILPFTPRIPLSIGIFDLD